MTCGHYSSAALDNVAALTLYSFDMNAIQKRRSDRNAQGKRRGQGSRETVLENTRIVAAWLAGEIKPEDARHALGVSHAMAYEIREAVVRAGVAVTAALLEGRK